MDVLKVQAKFVNIPIPSSRFCNNSVCLFFFQKIKSQLNPFGPVFRPIVARFISNLEQTETIENQVICGTIASVFVLLWRKLKIFSFFLQEFVIFCRGFIETFLKVLMKIYTLQYSTDNISRALRSINVHHESNAVSTVVSTAPVQHSLIKILSFCSTFSLPSQSKIILRYLLVFRIAFVSLMAWRIFGDRMALIVS